MQTPQLPRPRMPRRNFTNPTKRSAFNRSKGICECHRIPHVFSTPCGMPLRDGQVWYEHINCDELSHDNSLDNCAALTPACGRYKTDYYDKPTIAKSNRVLDRARGIKRTQRPFRGWRKFNGEAVWAK